jgi:hypothetical protein
MTTNVMAVNALFLGNGNNGEWKAYGFNLDGLDSTATSTGLCQLNDGAAPDTPYPDGNNGIDNSFGKNLLPVILGVDPNWVSDVSTALMQGQFTALLEMDNVCTTGDDPSFQTKVFAGTPLGMTPKWDGTDMWPVEPDLLNNPKDPESSSIVFQGCSVTGQMFSFTGTTGVIVLTVPVMLNGKTTSLKLTLNDAHVSMTLSADRKSGMMGMIGGVLDTEELVVEADKLIYLLGYCGTTEQTLVEQLIRQASDIMNDGTQDPTKVCNGISVGFGFSMAPAQIGSVGPFAPPPVTCMGTGGAGGGGTGGSGTGGDAGTDASSDGG